MAKHSLSPIQNPSAKRTANSQSEPNEYGIAASSTWFAIGQCAISLNLEQVALRAFEAALRHTPDHIDSLINLSRTLRKTHKEQSVEVLVNAFSRFPNLNHEPLLWKELAESHLALKQYDQSHQAISRALSIRSNDPELLLIAARSLEFLNPSHAQHTYQTVLSIVSQRPGPAEAELARECHYRLGVLASGSQNWKNATTELQAAISFALQQGGETELLWCTLANARERANDTEGALQVCRDAFQVVGYQRRISIMAAYLSMSSNKPQQADTEYAISILSPLVMTDRDDDLDCLAWYLLGKAHSLNNNPRQAYDAFQCALKKGKSSPLPWLAVGALYLRMGQLPDALAAYSQAASLLVEDGSQISAVASAAAWDGLACVYERCDDQAVDAADAYSRAASCYRAADDMRAATQAEQRAHSLQAASRGEAPVPALRPIPETSPALLRDMVMKVILAEPIKVEAPEPARSSFHHLPLPTGSLASGSSVVHSPTEKGTPQWRPQVPLHVSPTQQMTQPPHMIQQPPPPPLQQQQPPPPPPQQQLQQPIQPQQHMQLQQQMPPQQIQYPPPPPPQQIQQHPMAPMQQQMPYYPPPGVVWR